MLPPLLWPLPSEWPRWWSVVPMLVLPMTMTTLRCTFFLFVPLLTPLVRIRSLLSLLLTMAEVLGTLWSADTLDPSINAWRLVKLMRSWGRFTCWHAERATRSELLLRGGLFDWMRESWPSCCQLHWWTSAGACSVIRA